VISLATSCRERNHPWVSEDGIERFQTPFKRADFSSRYAKLKQNGSAHEIDISEEFDRF